MLSTKNAKIATKILALLLVAVFSFFIISKWLPQTDFVKSSLAQVQDSENTVLAIEATTLAVSFAISMLPNDTGESYTQLLTDLNLFFLFILVILFFEKIMLVSGIKCSFMVLIPIACGLFIMAMVTKKEILKSFATKIFVVALAIALVVPCGTNFAELVSEEMNAYVDAVIYGSEDGAEQSDAAEASGGADSSIVSKISGVVSTAVDGAKSVMNDVKNMITKLMTAVAIVTLKIFVLPLLTFFGLKWLLKEVFGMMVPAPQINLVASHHAEEEDDKDVPLLPKAADEPVMIGE